MTAPELPAVADLASSLGEEILADNSNAVFQLTGQPWSGKSTALSMLAEIVGSERVVLHAAPPAGANDAGPLAVMQVAAGLKAAGWMNGESAQLRDPARPLEDKIELVRGIVRGQRAVLLLDEPDRWGARSDTTGHFAERAEVVASALVGDFEVTTLFTGPAPAGVRGSRRFKLPHAAAGHSFLLEARHWGPLVEIAAGLAIASETNAMTPLELRLLVAAAAKAAREACSLDLSRRDRADALFAFLDSADEEPHLGHAWRALATIRGSFDDELLRRFVGDLAEDDDAVLRHCLLLSSGGEWSMHETLRADARRNRGMRDDPKLTSFLAEHYDEATSALDRDGDASALTAVMEASYYAATSRRRDIVERRACFVEQLDLLGKMLSLEQRDYVGAVEIFELALSFDDQDDYAAHYIGFNLDRLGREPAKAEEKYRLAIELNDHHIWWRSRLISFLVERGQLTQARREWDDALDAVLPPDGTSDAALYETLHGWVAATLLRVGELRFARSIMTSVPSEVTDRSPMVRDLSARLRALEIADADGTFVPANLVRDGWWSAPSLLQARIGPDDRLRLRRWLAGRIEAVDDGYVELRVADLAPGAESPRYARTRVAVHDFDSWTRDEPASQLAEGRFVEIGLYSAEDGSEATRLLRVHPEHLVGGEAPPVVAPLDRWHQALAGTVS